MKKRPHVDEFIVEMGKYFEVVIFTASLPKVKRLFDFGNILLL